VVLGDGKPIPPDMRVVLSSQRSFDSQVTALSPDGRFEFQGLPAAVFDIAPGVKGYRLPEGFSVETLVNRNVDDLVIQMVTGQP